MRFGLRRKRRTQIDVESFRELHILREGLYFKWLGLLEVGATRAELENDDDYADLRKLDARLSEIHSVLLRREMPDTTLDMAISSQQRSARQ